MKTLISLSARSLAFPAPEKLVAAAIARVEDLVKGSTRTLSNDRHVHTYCGTLDLDLITAVKRIMASAVTSGALQLDTSVTNSDDIPPIMDDAAPVTSQTQLAYLDREEAQVLTVQLFKFGKSKAYGYIVSIRKS